MELLPGAAEGGQPGHVPAQGVQGAGVGACGVQSTDSHCPGHASPQPRLQQSSRHLEMPPASPSPVFTEASTTLQGEFFRWPVITSFWKGFSPSSTKA